MSAKTVRLTVVLIAVGMAACGGSETPLAPSLATSITPNSSTALSAIAGAAVTELPSVVVKDQRGSAMGGVPVTFTVTGGGGAITEGTVSTTASGVATVGGWTLGILAGSNTLSAGTSGLTPVTFTAAGIAGSAAAAVKTAGDAQTAIAGTAVSTAPAVTVKDANGNSVSGVNVIFAVAGGGGSVTGGSQVTNTAGVATVGAWTLGGAAGTNTLTATVGSLPALTFTATGGAGSAASAVKTAGDAQVAIVGTAVSTAPAVLVKDANDNPVSGVTVTFAIASGGGTVTSGTQPTNTAGVATVGRWTLGAVAGTNTLTATVGSIPALTFTATGGAGAATSVVKTAGDGQTATAGTAVSVPPAVTVKDANGNLVGGVTVTFAMASGGGSVTGGTQTTNSVGVASIGEWTLGSTAGPNSLNASAVGLSPVTFTATGIAGEAASVTKMAGDARTATVGTAVDIRPSVTVRDANGNPVSGVTVTFEVASGGGSVTGGVQTTNNAGIATVGGWTLGAVGENTLTATAGSLPALTFTATGATGVGGIINVNTTFALANSPYRLTSDVQIAYGAILTIEAGVTVHGVNHRISVFGALNAVGTALSRIQFYDVRITPGANRELEPFRIGIEYADLNRGSFYAPTGNAIYGSFTLRNSKIRDAADYMYVWYPVANTYIERNTFINSGGISIGADLRTNANHVYIRNNSFQRWTALNAAVVNWASYGGEAVVLKYNSFLSTDRVAVRVETDGQLNATENYWNTVNEAVIQSMIFDKNDDLATPGFVEYRPFLTQPDPNTPTN